jgi:hypothetical protein
MFRYYFMWLAFSFIFLACGNKKKPSLTGTDPVAIEDIIESFELITPPYDISDTTLNKKTADSLLIATNVFTQFIPDSVLTKLFAKNAKPKIYLGKKVVVEGNETYLFVKAVTNEKRAMYVFAFDKENKYKGYLPLLVADNNPATSQISGINKKFEFHKTTAIKEADGSASEGKEVYIFSADAGFILIMTDALDDRVVEVINPIDTMTRKNKFSTDYTKDKMNLVSIRDGSKPGTLNFFIHFDKNNGECTGELKGSATISSTNTAVYKQAGDACSIQFTFSSSSVSLKELEPCGAHRGVKCSFDGNYPRKKEVRKKVATKK